MSLIWIVNQFANTPDLAGHTRQYEISKYLVKKNWKVELFSSDFSLSERKFKKLTKKQLINTELINGIEWNWLRVISYKKNNFKRILNMLSFCLNLSIIFFIKLIIYRKEVKVIYASSPQLPSAFVALIFSKLFRIPFFFEVRDLWPQVLIDQKGVNCENIFIKVLKILENKLYKYSDEIIVLSKNSIDYIKERGGSNISWLPNGPQLNNFIFSKLPYEGNGFNLERPFRIVYTGAHGESNDLINVVKAAELIQELPILLILVGDGPEKNKLLRISKNLNNIKFLDPIPKYKIPAFIEKSDAVLISLKNVLVFKYGISPNKLYDAYAIGRPVITTIEGAINDEVKNYNLGVTCKAENPELLAKSIKKLFNLSREQRSKMGERGRQLAERIYSREIINKKMDKLLKKYV